MGAQEKLNELRTLKKSYSDLADKVLPVSDFAIEVQKGKESLATAITNKGVPCSTEDSIDMMAEKVSLIHQEHNLDGESVTGNAIFPTEYMWNIITEAYAHQRGDYSSLILCEYLKENISTINLNGADAYYTSDGDFYSEAVIHKWHDNNDKVNRYVIYYFKNSGIDFNIADISPLRLVVLGSVGVISYAIQSTTTDMYILGEVKDIIQSVVQGISAQVVNRYNIKEHSNGVMFNRIKNTHTINLFVEKITGGSVLTIGGSASAPIRDANENVRVLNIHTNEVSSCTIVNGDNNQINTFESQLLYINIYGAKKISNSYIFGGSATRYDQRDQALIEVNMPDVEEFINSKVTTSQWQKYLNQLKKIYMPKCISLSGSMIINGALANSCPTILEDIEVGELISSINLQGWNPTTLLASPADTLRLIENVKNHIANKVSDRTGQSALTATFGFRSVVASYSAGTSEQNAEIQTAWIECVNIFNSKNWNVN